MSSTALSTPERKDMRVLVIGGTGFVGPLVAEALAVADGRGAGRVYNVGEAEALTEAEWIREIGRAGKGKWSR